MTSRAYFRFPRFLTLAIAMSFPVVLSLGTVGSTPAFAQKKAPAGGVEGEAKALQKKAMEEDYVVNVAPDKAIEKLNQAVAKCGDKCSPALRASLRRDIGTLQFVALNKKDDAGESLREAIKIDPNVALDPDVKTKELEAFFAELKKPAGAAPAASGKPGAAAVAPAATPTGDFTHTAASQELVRTPLPIFAEYGGSESVVKVIARYRGFGMSEWKTVELRKMGTGYGGLVPCADVAQGDLVYYLQGFNSANDPVATSGDRNNPYRVAVKQKLDAGVETPHLPNQPAPKQCQESVDCPPDFPGCKKAEPVVAPSSLDEPTAKADGEECEESAECSSKSCKGNVCVAGDDGSPKKFRRFWVGLNMSMDFVVLGSQDEVCRLDPATAAPINNGNFYCTNPDGSDYPRVNDGGEENNRIIPNKKNSVTGGVAPGTFRLMASFDYALTTNFMLGARLGYVFGVYPGAHAGKDGRGPFAPLHLELRATYVVGRDALAKAGFAPIVFLGGGVQELDAKVDVSVLETGLPAGSNKTVQAWGIGGPGFVAGGGGVRYAIVPRAAITAAAKITAAFGPNGVFPAISPEVGVQFGF